MQQIDVSSAQVRTFRSHAVSPAPAALHDLIERAGLYAIIAAFWGVLLLMAMGVLH